MVSWVFRNWELTSMECLRTGCFVHVIEYNPNHNLLEIGIIRSALWMREQAQRVTRVTQVMTGK